MARKVKEPRQLAFDEMVRTPQATVSFAIDESFPEKLANELAQQEPFNQGEKPKSAVLSSLDTLNRDELMLPRQQVDEQLAA